MTVSMTVLLAGGYAVGLLVVAELLDRLARHTAVRSERFRTAGFRYHPTHDAWICPQDQYLWPQEYDAERRVVLYRGKPSVCNACPVRAGCTSSAHGREVARALDPWPHSEAGRFHRALSLVLVVVAALFVLSAAVVSHDGADLLVVSGVLALAVGQGWRLSDHLRHTPANAPPLAAAAPVLAAEAPARPSRWASDRRRVDGDGVGVA